MEIPEADYPKLATLDGRIDYLASHGGPLRCPKQVSGQVLNIDGSIGEGGGQVLRTSLALAVITGKPFRMTNIRRRRAKPGLMPQHVKAVEAAGAVGMAHVEGDRFG